MGRFHRYSFHNLCLIIAQCPTATRVAGFQTWRTMSRFVRKGEKGIAILAPIIGRRHTDAADDDSKTVLGFRAAYVFDSAATDGEPLPAAAEASGDQPTHVAHQLARRASPVSGLKRLAIGRGASKCLGGSIGDCGEKMAQKRVVEAHRDPYCAGGPANK
jgi:hypothetical protein